MTTRENKPVEVAKTLALAISYFKRELKKRDENLHQYFESLLQTKLSAVQEAISSIPEPTQYALPESVVHDSNLHALREAIEYALSKESERLKSNIEETKQSGSRQLFENLEIIRNKIEEKAGAVEQKLLETFEEERARREKERETDLNEQSIYFSGLDGKINQVDANLRTAKDQLTETLEENKKESATELNKARNTFTAAIKILDEMIHVTDETTKASLKTLSEDVANQFKTITISVDGRFAEVIQQLEVAIATVVQDMEVRFKKHGDLIDGRLGAADKKKSIQDQAIAKRIEDFEKNVSRDIAKTKVDIHDTNIKLGQAEERLATAIVEVDKKLPDKKDILQKSDLGEIKKQIISEIPVPKDGQDAHEWLFRPHPTKRGVMLYKREDWKKWKEVVLAVNPPQEYWSGSSGPSGTGGGGGGFTGTPNFTSRSITTDTIADPDVDIWLVDASAGDVSLVLPVAAVKVKKMIWVKRINITGGDVLILPSMGGDTLEYNTDIILTGPIRTTAQFYSTGTGYVLLSALY